MARPCAPRINRGLETTGRKERRDGQRRGRRERRQRRRESRRESRRRRRPRRLERRRTSRLLGRSTRRRLLPRRRRTPFGGSRSCPDLIELRHPQGSENWPESFSQRDRFQGEGGNTSSGDGERNCNPLGLGEFRQPQTGFRTACHDQSWPWEHEYRRPSQQDSGAKRRPSQTRAGHRLFGNDREKHWPAPSLRRASQRSSAPPDVPSGSISNPPEPESSVSLS
jgi:hypothetical protein